MSNKISNKLENQEPVEKQYNLQDFEFAYIHELAVLLQYHIARELIIENFLTYVATQRLGYQHIKPGHKLKFDVDTLGEGDNPQPIVKISQVPIDTNN